MTSAVVEQPQPPPRMRRARRLRAEDDRLGPSSRSSRHQRESVAVSLEEFVRRNPLPSIVRVTSGWYADIGCGSDDADAEIYVHSVSTITTKTTSGANASATVYAQVMRCEDRLKPTPASNYTTWRNSNRYGKRSAGPATVRRLVATGRTVCLPFDGIEVAGCWFELLSEDGQAAPAIKSVEELANRALRSSHNNETPATSRRSTRYLVRQTIFGSVGSTQSAAETIQPGRSLTPVRLVSSSPTDNRNPPDTDRRSNHRHNRRHIQLQCIDDNNRPVFLPIDQQGLFNPIAESDSSPESVPSNGIAVVYDGLRSVVSAYRLPVTVRVVAGRLSLPDSAGVSSSSSAASMIFRLTGVSLQNSDHEDTSNEHSDADDNNGPVINVMSLRHAWSYGSAVSSSASTLHLSDDEDDHQTPLLAIPSQAARSLTVVVASKDFHVSWLKTDDGRNLALHCDRIISRRLKMVTEKKYSPLLHIDDYSIDRGGRRSLPRRQASLDSGLAMSGLNDDLYDEIDHIYYMIRYGAGGQPVLVDPHNVSAHRQRTKSYAEGISGRCTPLVGCRVEGNGSVHLPRGITAVFNQQQTPEVKRRVEVKEKTAHNSTPRRLPGNYRQGTASKAITATKGRHPADLQRANNRPSSRGTDGVIPVTENMKEQPRPDGDGRSAASRPRSTRSSVIAYFHDDSGEEDQRITGNTSNSVTGINRDFSPVAIAHSGDHNSCTGEAISDADRESGNATGAELTTTSGESPTFRANHTRSRNETPEVVRTPASGRKMPSSVPASSPSNDTTTTTPVLRSIPTPTGAMPDSQRYQQNNRKSKTVVSNISQSLANAFRRIGKRTTGNVAVSGKERSQSSNAALEEVDSGQFRRKNIKGNKKRSKSGEREKKSSTYYDINGNGCDDDVNNNRDTVVGEETDDDLEVFDIGDGWPNVDARRDWYGTTRSRRSWAATVDPIRTKSRSSIQLWHDTEQDPPLLLNDNPVAANQRQAKRSSSPMIMFGGNQRVIGRKNEFSVYTSGQYKNIGLY